MGNISERYAHLSPLKQALLALEEMKVKLDKLEHQQTEPIAIIGMGCRFPGGANDPEAFWQLLHQGIDAIQEVPLNRWNINAHYDPDPNTPGKMHTHQGGFLKTDVDGFDTDFFGLSPREVANMDPQQRLLLEVSWEALELAGQQPEQLVKSQTGVFVGANTTDYSQLCRQAGDDAYLNPYFFTGNTLSVAAGRISYLMGFEGPSVTLDTACSSSLMAIHLACQSLRAGECSLALAGGVNLMLSAEYSIILSKMQALAADGRCKTFDASADGYGRGEGCGIVVLKRLSEAVANHDNILALIRGTAANHDGRSSGLTVPNGVSQQGVIRAALANARVAPSHVGYVEVHGTGTALGDPIEVEALSAVLSEEESRKQPLILGTVKTNIGHLEAASGVAGLIKVVLAMQHEEIPPHLHLKKPNPAIAWDKLQVAIPTESIPWRRKIEEPRLAGVSSFGMSGTNVHVILEEAPVNLSTSPTVERPIHLLTLSAKSDSALKEVVTRFESYLKYHTSTELSDICFTTNVGRAHFAHRLTIIANSSVQALETISAVANGATPDGVFTGIVPSTRSPKVAFLFTGQGSQYVGMGRQLYETQPTFRRALERCDELLQPYLEQSLLSVLYSESRTTTTGSISLLDQTAYTQPALFALEYALAQLWLSWGIKPAIVMGHSVGELVAACVAGVFSLEDGLKLIAHRARLMQGLPSGGEMAAVFADEARVRAAIAPLSDQIAIAALNGLSNTVISGVGAAVKAVVAALEANGIESRPLKVSHAFHSPLMEPIQAEFEQIAAEITYTSPRIRVVSNLTGKLVEGGELGQADYWCRHIREPVQFATSIQTLREQGCDLFVEIGSHPVLLGMGQQCISDDIGVWLPSLRRGHTDWQLLLQSLSALYVNGVEVDWTGFHSDYQNQRLPLPSYPFQRSRYWLNTLPSKPAASPLSAQSQRFSHDWLYTVEWQIHPRKAQVGSSPFEPPAHWLIFADRKHGIGTALATLLEKHGESCTLIFSEDTSGVAVDTWSLNPVYPEEFQELIKTFLEQGDRPLRGIVHLWSLDSSSPETTTVTSLQTDQNRNCASVLHLVQALNTTRSSLRPKVWLVTQGVQPVKGSTNTLAVVQAPILGLGRVVAVEHPEIWGGLIDIGADTCEDAAASCFEEIWQPDCEPEVVIRSGQRYVPRFVRYQASLSTQTIDLHPDKTYLVTGGLGGLGLKLAQWMVNSGARYLVLTGRRSPSKEAREQIEKLEAAGAKVVVAQADVTQVSQIQQVLANITQSLPPLRGIIHLAGILDDGVLSRQTWERFTKVMAPKVMGTWNLHVLTQDASLDFFVCFSSVASLIGSPGQGNYSAANAFLDILSDYRRQQGLPALCINWGPWGETGMAANLEKRWAAMGIDAIEPQQGLQLLGQILNLSATQIAVLPVKWAQFFAQYSAGMISPFFRAFEKDLRAQNIAAAPTTIQQQHFLLEQLKATPSKRRRATLVSHIQKDVAQILGRDTTQLPDPQLGFFEMGMDSLMSLELRNRLQANLGQTFPSTLTFEYPTIDALTGYFLSEGLALETLSVENTETQENTKVQSQILTEVEQLSANELEILVDVELASLIREN